MTGMLMAVLVVGGLLAMATLERRRQRRLAADFLVALVGERLARLGLAMRGVADAATALVGPLERALRAVGDAARALAEAEQRRP